MWFSFGKTDIAEELRQIKINLSKIGTEMATFAEIRDQYKAFASDMRAQRDAAINALGTAETRANDNARALAAYQADDEATDAQQLVDAEQALADQLSADLRELRALDTPAEPDPTQVPDDVVVPEAPLPDTPAAPAPADPEAPVQ